MAGPSNASLSIADLKKLTNLATPQDFEEDDSDAAEFAQITRLMQATVIDVAAEAARAESRLQGASVLPSGRAVNTPPPAAPFLFKATQAATDDPPSKKQHQKKPKKVNTPQKTTPLPLSSRQNRALEYQRINRENLVKARRTPASRLDENITPANDDDAAAEEKPHEDKRARKL